MKNIIDFTKMETVANIAKGSHMGRIATNDTAIPKGTIVTLSEYSYDDETWKATTLTSELEVWIRVSHKDVEREPVNGFID